MAYQITDSLFDSRRQAIRAHVTDWLTASGTTGRLEVVLPEIADQSAEQLAADCLASGWCQGVLVDTDTREVEEIDAADIVEAIEAIRAEAAEDDGGDDPDDDDEPAFRFSIFDSADSVVWPTHELVPVEAETLDEAVASVREVLRVEASGLNPADGYEPGQTILAYIYDQDGDAVRTVTAEVSCRRVSAYPADVAEEVSVRRPDLAANDAIAVVLGVDPTLTADEVIEELDQAAKEWAAEVSR